MGHRANKKERNGEKPGLTDEKEIYWRELAPCNVAILGYQEDFWQDPHVNLAQT